VGVGDGAEGFDSFLGDLFLPAAVPEGEEVEEGVESFGDVGLAEPEGEGEEGAVVRGGEGDRVGALDEGFEEGRLGSG
jgi:hypothetical protein